MDISKLTKSEKRELLNNAKDAYYNTGKEILSDSEYDELEKELGLENNNYIGSKQGNYEVKHSFIMGSLSKVQVKEQKDGTINWNECANTINSFLKKANGTSYYETTPKLDGCSFSLEFVNNNGKAKLLTVATRGNGEYGSNIKHWFEPLLNTPYWSKIDDAVNQLCQNKKDILCIRGEVLVKQQDFSKKYAEQYVNPRAFAAGMLGIKYEDATPIKLMQGKDLHFVCYDYRIVSNGKYRELSWMNANDPTFIEIGKFLGHIGELPDKKYCQVHEYTGNFSEDELKDIYDDYDNYRQNISEYALDGVVFKPMCSARKYNEDRPRPVDCIAMKFMPMINLTTIIDIDWKAGKTGEYFPTAILEPIIMPDGKKITRASLHNYDYIITNKVGIGSKVRISLAGDIIPFVYEIVESKDPENNMNLPKDGFIDNISSSSGNMHYMKKFSEYEEQKNKFMSSADTLNINTIGPAAAEYLYNAFCEDVPDLENILYLMNDECYKKMFEIFGDGKSIQNIVDNLKNFANHITLYDIIRSFNFQLCGNKAAEQCARIMSGLSYSTSSLPEVSYSWALDKNSKNYYMVKSVMDDLGVDFIEEDDNEEKIPVILTGDPSECTNYSTKAKFMQAHGKLKETTSWKEVKILFTNSLDSKTGKMQKAAKLGIEVRTYDDANEFLTAKNTNETNIFNSKTKELFDFNAALF